MSSSLTLARNVSLLNGCERRSSHHIRSGRAFCIWAGRILLRPFHGDGRAVPVIANGYPLRIAYKSASCENLKSMRSLYSRHTLCVYIGTGCTISRKVVQTAPIVDHSGMLPFGSAAFQFLPEYKQVSIAAWCLHVYAFIDHGPVNTIICLQRFVTIAFGVTLRHNTGRGRLLPTSFYRFPLTF